MSFFASLFGAARSAVTSTASSPEAESKRNELNVIFNGLIRNTNEIDIIELTKPNLCQGYVFQLHRAFQDMQEARKAKELKTLVMDSKDSSDSFESIVFHPIKRKRPTDAEMCKEMSVFHLELIFLLYAVVLSTGKQYNAPTEILDGRRTTLTNVRRTRRRQRGGARPQEDLSLFIENSKKYTSATGFYDGIANYLYGVMSKERLSQVGDGIDYKEKFNQSLASLSNYDTLASSLLMGLIEFNFNHISEAASRGRGTRYGEAALIMSTWLRDEPPIPIHYPGTIDNLFIDVFTQQICDWIIRFDKLTDQEIADMTDNLNSELWTEYDKTKIRIILAEKYFLSGQKNKAHEFVRYVSSFDDWREKFY